MRIPTVSPEASRNAALLIPLVLVNALAVWGQAGWANEQLPGNGWTTSVAAVGFAAAVESIGVYLAYEAHVARLAGDASGWLAASAYGVAGFAAAINWSHWSTQSRTLALVFAAMSGISPWLWSIRSRSIHRERLRRKGLIEERAVRFGRARWVLYPRRTFSVFRAAVWAGEVDPTTAIEAYNESPAMVEATPIDRSAAVEPSTPTVGPAVSELATGASAPVGLAPSETVKPAVKRSAALRSVRPSQPKVEVRADSRVAGTDAEKVAALVEAVKSGAIKSPLSVASVGSIVVASGEKRRQLRDEATALLALDDESTGAVE